MNILPCTQLRLWEKYITITTWLWGMTDIHSLLSPRVNITGHNSNITHILVTL